ncbi:MAG: hypothetical protein M3122_02450 [Actinomycetota bacterium]|nr:hypothetical protein [Actinomycetota bacterium]
MTPYNLYRRWLDNLQEASKQMNGDPAGFTNLYENWQRWMEATTETWRRAAEVGTRMAGMAAPRWIEMAEGVQKQMLGEGGLPTDPMDFYTRWYNATSEPLSKLADDILRDEAFLASSRRLIDYYSISDSIFRRASEEYFSNLQLPTSSDTNRIAELVVALDDRTDRIEEMLEEIEPAQEEPATAGAVDNVERRLERVESRLDQLDRVESKLDQVLAAQNTTAGDGQ